MNSNPMTTIKMITDRMIKGCLWLLALIPLRGLYLLADLIYYFLIYVLKYRKKYVMENLRNSFPEKSENELKDIARRFYRHFCDLVVEILRIAHMKDKELLRRMTFPDIEILHELYDKKKNIIIVTGHYNNWEWLHHYPLISGYRCLVVYMPLANKYFDKWMNNSRSCFGGVLLPFDDTYRMVLDFYRKNELFLVGLIADQAPPPESPWWTTFLHQETAFFLGPEKIAKKLDMTVIYQKINKIRRGYYNVTYEVITDDPKNTKPFEITETFIRLLERDVREKPEYWLWTHRRWKHKRP